MADETIYPDIPLPSTRKLPTAIQQSAYNKGVYDGQYGITPRMYDTFNERVAYHDGVRAGARFKGQCDYLRKMRDTGLKDIMQDLIAFIGTGETSLGRFPSNLSELSDVVNEFINKFS